MNAREYLSGKPTYDGVTFIIASPVKRAKAPGYDTEYRTTPIWTASEWLRGTSVDNYLVINADHPPIDITGHWGNMYKRGHLHCAVLQTEADLILQYGEEQGKRMIAYYKRNVKRHTQRRNTP